MTEPVARMQYPVTATQWHPEKNVFEWATHLHVPHSYEAVRPQLSHHDACMFAAVMQQHVVWYACTH